MLAQLAASTTGEAQKAHLLVPRPAAGTGERAPRGGGGLRPAPRGRCHRLERRRRPRATHGAARRPSGRRAPARARLPEPERRPAPGGGAGDPPCRGLAPGPAAAPRGDLQPPRDPGPEGPRLRRPGARLRRDAGERRGPRAAGAAGRRDRRLRGDGRRLPGPAGARRHQRHLHRAVAPPGGPLVRAAGPARPRDPCLRGAGPPRAAEHGGAGVAGPHLHPLRRGPRAGLGDEADGDGRAIAAEADRSSLPAGHARRGDAGRQAAGRAVLRGDPRPQAGRRRRDQVPRQGAHRERALARAGLAHRPGDPARRVHRPQRGDVRPHGPPRAAAPARLRDPRGALDIFEDVLRRKQGHAGAIGALEEMARSDSPLRGEAAEALEPIFTSGGDHLRLVQMLESRASTEPVAQERAALLRKVAKLYAGPDAEPRPGLRLGEPGPARASRRGGLTHPLGHSFGAGQPRRRGAGRAPRGDPPPRLGGRRARRHPPRAGQGPGEARARGGGRSTPGAGCWRSVPSDSEAMGSLVQLYQAAGRAPELLEIYKRQLAISDEAAVRAALLFQIAGASRWRAPRHRRSDGHPPAPAGAEARRRPGAGEAGLALREAGALARAGGRHRPTAGAPGRGPGPRSPDPAGGGPRDAAPRQVRGARAVRAGAGRAAEASRCPGPARGLGAARAPEQAAGRGAPRRVPDRRRAGEARLRSSSSGSAPRPIPSSASSCWSSWPGCARRRRTRPGSSARWPEPSRRTPTTPCSAAGWARRPTRRGPTPELAQLYEEELPRIAETKDAALVLLELGELYEQHLSNPARAIEVLERSRELDDGHLASGARPRWRGCTGRPGGATGWSRAWTSWRSSPRT